MKRIAVVCSLGVIFVLMFLAVQLYPTRKNVVQGKYYNITNSVYSGAIYAKIIPSDINLSKGKISINKLLLNDENTRIYLKNIFSDGSDRVVITFDNKITWHFPGGSFVTTTTFENNGSERIYSGAPIKFNITDENNNNVPYLQYGAGPVDVIQIILDKDVFTSCDEINIEIKGYNLAKYTRRFKFM